MDARNILQSESKFFERLKKLDREIVYLLRHRTYVLEVPGLILGAASTLVVHWLNLSHMKLKACAGVSWWHVQLSAHITMCKEPVS